MTGWDEKRRRDGITSQQLADALAAASGSPVSQRALYDYARGKLPRAAATFRLLDAYARGDVELVDDADGVPQLAPVDSETKHATALATTRKLAEQILALTDRDGVITLIEAKTPAIGGTSDSAERVQPGYRISRNLHDRIQRAFDIAHAADPARFSSVNALVEHALSQAFPDLPEKRR